MKNLSNRMKTLLLVAAASFLLMPVVAGADQYVELGTVVFGPGVDTETYQLGSPALSQKTPYTAQNSTNPSLKSLIISVTNGTQKGKDRASSAVVNVNGEDIFTQKQFNQNVASLTTTRDVDDPDMPQVVLTTKVNGHKNVRLAVTVTAVYEEQESPTLWCLYSSDGMPMGLVQPGEVAPPPMLGGEWRQCP